MKQLPKSALVRLALFVLAIAFVTFGCTQTSTNHVGATIEDGAVLTATYVGEETCIGCHRVENSHWSHTVHARIFRNRPGNDPDELQAGSCEACHGPGSNHATDLTAGSIISFTRGSHTPVARQNAQCSQCHNDIEHAYWPGSTHQTNDVACSDCHNPMAEFSPGGLLRVDGISETCAGCHRPELNDFRKRSHMPLLEGKISCIDCHASHGSATSPLLKAESVNSVCYTCHAEKRGPFLWEHAPVRDNCMNCHEPHGSNHDMLLTAARPFLCQQCHTNRGHPNDLLVRGNAGSGSAPDPRLLNRSCQNCHAQIHGSNHPSGSKFHR